MKYPKIVNEDDLYEEEIKKLEMKIKQEEDELTLLKPFEENYNELQAKFKSLKEEIQKQGLVDASESTELSELLELIYNHYIQIVDDNKKKEEEIKNVENKMKILEGIHIEEDRNFFPDAKYTGQIKKKDGNKIPHGIGILEYDNGDKFEGEFIEKKENDIGILYKKNGDIYLGRFQDKKYEGIGILFFDYLKNRGNEFYIGEFKNGEIDGPGRNYFFNGDLFDGIYSKGKKEGFGKQTFAKGGEFEGYFHNDMRDGKGKETFSNGDSAEGEWKMGMKNGFFIVNRQGTIFKEKYTNDILDPN